MADLRRHIIVTRQLSEVGDFTRRFPSDLFSVTEWPTFSSSSLVQAFHMRHLFDGIDQFDAILFASQMAVVNTLACMEEMALNADDLKRMKIYAMGPVTSRHLLSLGMDNVAIPDGNEVGAAVKFLQTLMPPPCKVLFPTTDKSAGPLVNGLANSGYQVVSPVVHRHFGCKSSAMRAYELLTAGQASCLALTSPSSVVAMQKIIGEQQLTSLLKSVHIASLDPGVSDAALAAGLRVDIQPTKSTLGDLAQAVMDFYS
jgi:uroporphyrinogen-III synthase